MQQTTFAFLKNHELTYGGELLKGKRKTARPLSTKHRMHFILKSNQATGKLAFINHLRAMEDTIARTSKKFRIKMIKFVVNTNHIHLVVQISSRRLYKPWIRALTGNIVQTLAKRTGERLTQFFDLRPFSRIIQWGKDLKNVLNYMIKNEMEYFGIFRKEKPKPEKHKRRGLTP